jgi:hypothetical protein
MGQSNQGTGLLSQGVGGMTGGSWEPSIPFLLGLVLAEMVLFHLLGRVLK